jgi:hypothetical protein
VTLYLDVPGPRGRLDWLIREGGAVVLPGPPRDLDGVPADRALVCVGDMGDYEAPGYIITEAEFAAWTDAADDRAKTWLLMDRGRADELCPGAAENRERWRAGREDDAEAAAHPDNLIPVARASRSALLRDAGLLRGYAAALGGEKPSTGPDGWPAGIGREHIAAADLLAIAKDLESWAEHDWIAVIDLGPEREHLAGPLPPFPGLAAG